MATLLVRRLDDNLVAKLKRRARAHGRSVEAEHRAILEEALKPAGESGAEVWERLRRFGTAELEPLPDEEIEPARFE
ncbi:MAG: Arc family DNA-binding protein [Geminicoccaceae bacterium]